MLAAMRKPTKVPTLTLMAVLARPVDGLDFDAAIVEHSTAFKWLARDSRKPGEWQGAYISSQPDSSKSLQD